MNRTLNRMTNPDDRRAMSPEDDPNWAQYVHTILELFADHSLAVDLTKPVSAEALAMLAEHGIGPTFAVLTACNPFGQRIDDGSNQRLSQMLAADVVAADRPWVPADGVSPDGSHREVGIAVMLAKDDARALARKYGQSAFYWFDGACMWIVGAVVDAADVRLPG
jgi:hypothetical protein